MAPDASKRRQGLASPFLDLQKEEANKANEKASEPESQSLECILEPNVLTNFSYVEQPMKCYLTFQGKRLACNGKSACFMVSESSTDNADALDEFVLLAQANGSIVLQNAKTQQFICSASNGGVYAPRTCHADLEKWTMTPSGTEEGSYTITSFAHPNRNLVCKGNMVETSNEHISSWKVDILSGEICFLSHPVINEHLYCDLLGNLSMSKTHQGWAAWRLAEAGNGYVRISPWAHANFYLTSAEDGVVSVTEERGRDEIWSVQKAPNELVGVILRSVRTGRVLHYNQLLNEFLTVPAAALDESCVWDLKSLHRQTYYLVTNDGTQRLEAAKRGVTTRRLPGRISSEEWKIHQSLKQAGVVTLFSNARQQYLGSNASGEVFLMNQSDGCSEKWVIEEREDGFVVLSQTSRRVLVSQDKGPISTVEPGTIVYGNTRWKLEPSIPRHISKEKVQAVGAAVAIGVAGTVAMPFLIGGAIGALGIAQVGVAGEVAIGSIRAVEALNTITRVSMSSSQLMIRQSSYLSSSDSSSKEYERETMVNRPFCDWRSW